MDPTLQQFADEYIANGGNAAEAYHHAHPKAKPNSCWTLGSKMLRNVEVLAYIAEKAEKKGVESDDVMGTFADAMRGSLAYFLQQDDEGNLRIDLFSAQAQKHIGLVKSIRVQNKVIRTVTEKKQTVQIEAQSIQIEIMDRLSAANSLARILGMFNDKTTNDTTLRIEGFAEIMEQVYGKKSDRQS